MEGYDTNETLKIIEAEQSHNPNAIYADSMRDEKVANVISQINPDNLLTDIEHRIRGEKKDHFTEQWNPISKHSKPVSEQLVANYISFLGIYLSQNTSLSNFSGQEINNIMEAVIDYVRDDLTANAKAYGIEGQYTEWTRIGHIICHSTFSVLKQAQNGMMAQRIFKALRVSETLGGQQKSKLDFLKFW